MTSCVAAGSGVPAARGYALGPCLGLDPLDTLRHVLARRPPGTALEFGVGSGRSLRLIAETMSVIGFDSFEGLPEDWRPGFPAGTFACEPPQIPNAHLVSGLFADTLPSFDFADLGPIGLVHIDCDLYSSTKTVLDHVEAHLLPGAYVVFDEAHGYPGCENHEWLAWRQFADRTGIDWSVVGHGVEQWAIRLR